MSMVSSSSVPSRSYMRPENLVGIGPRGFSSFFLKGFFLSFGGAGGPKSFCRAWPAPPSVCPERDGLYPPPGRGPPKPPPPEYPPPPENPPPPPAYPPGRGAPYPPVRGGPPGPRSSRARASLTASGRPMNSWPSNFLIASSATARSAYSTNANPRARPVSRSRGRTICVG
jgi:hypothetical protein